MHRQLGYSTGARAGQARGCQLPRLSARSDPGCLFCRRPVPAIQCPHGTRHLQAQAHAAVRTLPDEAIADLIEHPGVTTGAAGESRAGAPGDLVVLLEGGLAMGSDDGGQHLAAFSVDEDAPDPAILYTIPAGARLQLSRPSVYLVIDGQRLDDVLAGRQETKSLAALDDGVRERVASLDQGAAVQAAVLRALCRCAEAMQARGRRGRRGCDRAGRHGRFLLRHRGRARHEVLRADPGRKAVKRRHTRAGASFGEEALLKGEPRNATVRMTDRRPRAQARQGGFRPAAQEPSCCTRSAPEEAAPPPDSRARPR